MILPSPLIVVLLPIPPERGECGGGALSITVRVISILETRAVEPRSEGSVLPQSITIPWYD
jgi:hypothetical protein